MPLDGLGLHALVYELKNTIIGSKIEKIYQPDRYEILLHLRKPQENIKLLINSHPVLSRICITTTDKKNPVNPPPFCMLLRKYLESGEIIDIKQKGLDRIIEITFKSWKDEILMLYIEIMGKYSNIILTDKEYKIIDSLRHVDPEMSRVRWVMPGEKYVYPPPQNKLNLLSSNNEDIIGALNIPSTGSMSNHIVKSLEGFSGFLANAILMSCKLNPSDNVDIKNMDRVIDEIIKIKNKLQNNQYEPTLYLEKNEYKDFLPFNFDMFDSIRFNSMSLMVDEFYSIKELKGLINDRSSSLLKIINSNLDRCYRKLENLQDELASGKERDKYKEYADLIMANLSNIHKGMKSINVVNIFSESTSPIEIPLDPSLSPVENAQRYYKKYNKLKNSIKYIEEQIEETIEEIEFLESELNNLQNIDSINEIEEIKNELEAIGYIKQDSKKKVLTIKSKPRHFLSSDGYDIYVGKNNYQNDELTLRLSSANDIWLHTKDIPGSHVIIKTNGNNITDETLDEAATLAAYYSKARHSSNVPVDYTLKKFVKKPSGAKPGRVIYTNQKTIFITPIEEKIKSLKRIED
ncbi:Rqc2 family fibronectin-binding protein [Calorimonas adulescens]|nr:NFACT RNA binding domain-containing protein [Calorimonas adulescens]